MASFDYRLNPLYPIKECSFCGALYTTDYCCSDGSLVDKIICDLNKTLDLSQRPPHNCPMFGNPVDGHYCQGCALLRKELKKGWFTYGIENEIFQDFQDNFEPSNDNTNVVNALQEPFIVKQDPGKNSSQSPPHINHHCCYGCGDSLEDIFCHQCTCKSYGKGDHYGYNCPPKVSIILNPEPCNNQTIDELPQTLPSFDPTCYSGDKNSFTYDFKSNIVDDSPNVFNPTPYSYEFCGNDACYSYDFPLQVSFTYDPEPCYNQDFNFPQNFQIFQQQYLCCSRCGGPHETCQYDQLIFDEPYCEKCGGLHMSFQCQLMNQNHYEPNPCYDSNSFGFDQFQPPQFPIIHQPIREKTCAEFLAEERAANINTQPFQYSVVPQHPQEEISVEFLQEKRNQIDSVQTFLRKFNRISFYEIPKVLSLAWETILEIEHAFKDKHCQPEDILELFQRLHNDVQNIHEELAVYISTLRWDRPTICYNDDDDEDCTIAITPILSIDKPDNSLSMRDEHLDTILKTEWGELIKSSVENLVPIPSESEGIPDNMYSFSIDNIEYVEASPPDSELISSESSSTSLNFLLEETNTFDNSLPEYETFCFDLKEISSDSTTTHSDFSLYDSFIFDLLINPFPPVDRNVFYELADELAHIISLPEYDYFFFKNEPNSGDFTMDVVEDIFPTREPRVHVPNVLPTLQRNLDFILSSESLFAYVVWIFFPFLSYSVAHQYLLSFENEDTIFYPGISICHSFMPDVSHQSGTFMKFNVYLKHLNGSPMEILFSTCSLMDQ
nr:hypothetical protein [Tanacetum cinerariifolium]